MVETMKVCSAGCRQINGVCAGLHCHICGDAVGAQGHGRGGCEFTEAEVRAGAGAIVARTQGGSTLDESSGEAARVILALYQRAYVEAVRAGKAAR